MQGPICIYTTKNTKFHKKCMQSCRLHGNIFPNSRTLRRCEVVFSHKTIYNTKFKKILRVAESLLNETTWWFLSSQIDPCYQVEVKLFSKEQTPHFTAWCKRIAQFLASTQADCGYWIPTCVGAGECGISLTHPLKRSLREWAFVRNM